MSVPQKLRPTIEEQVPGTPSPLWGEGWDEGGSPFDRNSISIDGSLHNSDSPHPDPLPTGEREIPPSPTEANGLSTRDRSRHQSTQLTESLHEGFTSCFPHESTSPA